MSKTKVLSVKIPFEDVVSCLDIATLVKGEEARKTMGGAVSFALSILLQNLREDGKLLSYSAAEAEALLHDFQLQNGVRGQDYAAPRDCSHEVRKALNPSSHLIQHRSMEDRRAPKERRIRNDLARTFNELTAGVELTVFGSQASASASDFAPDLLQDVKAQLRDDLAESDFALAEEFDREINQHVEEIQAQEQIELLSKITREV